MSVNIAITFTGTGAGQADVDIEGTNGFSNKFKITKDFNQDFDLASDTYTISVMGTSGSTTTLDVTGCLPPEVHDSCDPNDIVMNDAFDV
jgi:hypothetical protein